MTQLTINLEKLNTLGYQQLIQTPDLYIIISALEKIKANPDVDISTIEDKDVQQLIKNMKKNSSNNFIAEIEVTLDSLIRITKCIKNDIDNTLPIKPAEFKEIGEVRIAQAQLSERLFVKDGEIYVVPYRVLARSTDPIVPQKANNFQGIYGIMTVKVQGKLVLEQRVQARKSYDDMSGHPALMDTEITSVVSAGEKYICSGTHRLTTNKTGNCHKQVRLLGMSEDEERAILNLCLRGMIGTFYKVVLKEGSTDIDETAHQNQRIAAGVPRLIPKEAKDLPASPLLALSILAKRNTEQADKTLGQQDKTSEQADKTSEQADATSEQADATSEQADKTSGQADKTSEQSNTNTMF